MQRRHFLTSSLAALAITSSCTTTQAPPTSSAPVLDTSSEREISYLIEREDQGKLTPVSEDFDFKSGDHFRLSLEPGFPAYIYVANRGKGEDTYKMLFPLAGENSRNPLPKGKQVALPTLRFDQTPGNEYFVLVASTVALPAFETGGSDIPREVFEASLAKVERSYRPDSSRRFHDGDKTKFFAARDGNLAIVVRLALAHS